MSLLVGQLSHFISFHLGLSQLFIFVLYLRCNLAYGLLALLFHVVDFVLSHFSVLFGHLLHQLFAHFVSETWQNLFLDLLSNNLLNILINQRVDFINFDLLHALREAAARLEWLLVFGFGLDVVLLLVISRLDFCDRRYKALGNGLCRMSMAWRSVALHIVLVIGILNGLERCTNTETVDTLRIMFLMTPAKELVGWYLRLWGQIVLVSNSLFSRTYWMKSGVDRNITSSLLNRIRKNTSSCKWRHKVLTFTLNQNVVRLFFSVSIDVVLEWRLDWLSLRWVLEINFPMLLLFFFLFLGLRAVNHFNRDTLIVSVILLSYSRYRLLLGPHALHSECFISAPLCVVFEFRITWQTLIFIWWLLSLLIVTLLEWLRVFIIFLWVVAGRRVALVIWGVVFVLGHLLVVVLVLLLSLMMELLAYWLFHANRGSANMLLLLWRSRWSCKHWLLLLNEGCSNVGLLLNYFLNSRVWQLRVWIVFFFVFRKFLRRA